MKIGYLVNQYPKVSHSFVRREIAALEALGQTVSRYTVRHTAIDHRWLNGKRSWLMATALTTGASVRR